jgi:hypothetical protein
MLSAVGLACSVGRAAAADGLPLLAALRPFAKKAEAKKAEAVTAVATSGADYKAVRIPEEIVKGLPTTHKSIAFEGDLRSTSGLGLGDGLKSHTDKWLQGGSKTPLEYIQVCRAPRSLAPVLCRVGVQGPGAACPRHQPAELVELVG